MPKSHPRKTPSSSRRGHIKMTAASAPISRSSIMRVRPMTIKSIDPRSINVSGCDFINPISIDTADTYGKVISKLPINTSFSLRLGQLAATYENYRYKNFKIHYVPTCPKTQAGSIMTFYDNDCMDDDSIGGVPAVQVGASHEFNIMSSVSDPFTFFVNCDLKQPPRFVHATGVDPRLYTQGQLFILWTGTTGATFAAGQLLLEYDIDLINPQCEVTDTIPQELQVSFTTSKSVSVPNNGDWYEEFPLDWFAPDTSVPGFGEIVAINTTDGTHNAFRLGPLGRIAACLASNEAFSFTSGSSTGQMSRWFGWCVGTYDYYNTETEWSGFITGDDYQHTGLTFDGNWYRNRVELVPKSGESNVVDVGLQLPFVHQNVTNDTLYLIPIFSYSVNGGPVDVTFGSSVYKTILTLVSLGISAFKVYQALSGGPKLTSSFDDSLVKLYRLPIPEFRYSYISDQSRRPTVVLPTVLSPPDYPSIQSMSSSSKDCNFPDCKLSAHISMGGKRL